MAAIEQTGGQFFVERLRLEWRPGTPIPEPTGRLAFRPVEEHTQLVTLMAGIPDGTLDAHGRADLATMSPKEAAVRQYEDELMSYESPRDWWRIAERPGGLPVGFVIPAHNGYNPIIAYIGVVPAHRAIAMSTKSSRRARAYSRARRCRGSAHQPILATPRWPRRSGEPDGSTSAGRST
jgi:hypothetical protein